MTDKLDRESLQVLDRTFAVLELFTPDRPAWTTTEVARECGLPIATAHRLLNALQRRGFVTRDEATKRFRLGVAALRLGERARDCLDLRSIALPVLRQLAQETGETTLLTVLNEARDHSLCIERMESAHPLRLSIQPGRLMPLYSGASQKILLAFLPEEERERIIAGPLEKLAPATIVDPGALRTELARIRDRRYAVSAEETNAGLWGIAVPILDGSGHIVAGLGCAGPLTRRTAEREAHHLARLRAGAAEIARALGLAGSFPSSRPDQDGAGEMEDRVMDLTGTEG